MRILFDFNLSISNPQYKQAIIKIDIKGEKFYANSKICTKLGYLSIYKNSEEETEDEEISKRITIDYTASGEIEYHKNKFRSNSSIYVDTGLFYNSRKNTDCGDFVVYDRKNKRLYFHATLR